MLYALACLGLSFSQTSKAAKRLYGRLIQKADEIFERYLHDQANTGKTEGNEGESLDLRGMEKEDGLCVL